jgi:segregation and condensation protein A
MNPTLNQQPIEQLPLDLYIPPDAMLVLLEQFEGPLDLLLYLIRKQNLDIIEVDLIAITDQYVDYVNTMYAQNIDLAADYLVMASTLMAMKSRLLLPKFQDFFHDNEEYSDDGFDEEDSSAELLNSLLEYEQFKHISEALDQQPRLGRENFLRPQTHVEGGAVVLPELEVEQLFYAQYQILQRIENLNDHHVETQQLSVSDRMVWLRQHLKTHQDKHLEFSTLYQPDEGIEGKVVSFLAVMELSKEKEISLMQNQTFGPIYIRLLDDNSQQG